MNAIQQAQKAASEAFDAYLGHDSAAGYVPASVVRAAQIAYAQAGGRAAIKVVGHGNRTHPVIGVTVYHDGRAEARRELAEKLRQYAAEIDHEERV